MARARHSAPATALAKSASTFQSSATPRRAGSAHSAAAEFVQRPGVDVPKRHGVAVFTKHFRQRGSPRAHAEHGNFHLIASGSRILTQTPLGAIEQTLDVALVFVNGQQSQRGGDDS